MTEAAPATPERQLSLPLPDLPASPVRCRPRRLGRRAASTPAALQPTLSGLEPPPIAAPLDAEALARELSSALGRPVSVEVTENRSTMVSFRPRGGGLAVRLHRIFLGAPPEVLGAVARWIDRRDRAASRAIDLFVRAARERVEPRRPRRAPRRSRGAHHDLGEVLADLDRRFFGGLFDGAITWGRGTTRRRQRSVRLGSYSPEERLIRINPALDRAFVPRFFVEWVVYHEMLHHVLGVPVVAGRRRIHTPAFRAMERAFPGADRAAAWERANVGRLLRR